jgi:hypothetical protein
MTKEEARAAIEAELFALKLRKRMALPEKIAFCESAHRRLVFQSETDRLRDILQWVEIWQSLWLPDKLASGEQVNVAVDATQQSPSNAWPGLTQIVLRIVNPGAQPQGAHSSSSLPLRRRLRTDLAK